MINKPSQSVMEWTPSRMLARLDGDLELAQQLAAIFVEECPNMLQRLRTAVAEGAADEVRRAAHALKGSLSNFIDGGPTATAFELETMGRDGRLDETARALERLEGEIAGLTVRLREFQSTRAKAS
jgi:HPt (histidine-containing phosphotransfer) domain-containing protein